ncbi:hypothetical protein AKJ09_03160 [Labilithrix luteola]|uniref:Uncharacterized protein n=1 Tax=Labilithrix luteola TaxID=1391654 RepID=A0A0K1PSZ5_9BACT|nr:hypothetical protein AKJ09_03160 [Labilithrix luteola]
MPGRVGQRRRRDGRTANGLARGARVHSGLDCRKRRIRHVHGDAIEGEVACRRIDRSADRRRATAGTLLDLTREAGTPAGSTAIAITITAENAASAAIGRRTATSRSERGLARGAAGCNESETTKNCSRSPKHVHGLNLTESTSNHTGKRAPREIRSETGRWCTAVAPSRPVDVRRVFRAPIEVVAATVAEESTPTGRSRQHGQSVESASTGCSREASRAGT